MRLAHGRAAWALTAAGSFSLALSALAQQPPPLSPRAAVQQTVQRDAPKTPAALASARLPEINVELAWLADPQTFRCQLAARKVGDQLEVGGFVPHAALKARALEIAGQHGNLPVADKLVVLPNSELKVQPGSQDALCQSAASLLGKIMSKFGAEFEFGTDGHGQITIAGNVPSAEEKLTISRRLSQLSGCTSVLNNMNVVADMPVRKPTLAAAPIVQPDGSLILEQHVSPPVVTSIDGKALPNVKIPVGPAQDSTAGAAQNRNIGGLAGRFMQRRNNTNNEGTLIAQQAVPLQSATIVNQTVVATSAMTQQPASGAQPVSYRAPAKQPTNVVQPATYHSPMHQPTNVVQSAVYRAPVQPAANVVQPVSNRAPVQPPVVRPNVQPSVRSASPYGAKVSANSSHRPQPAGANMRSGAVQVAQGPPLQPPTFAQAAPGTMSAAEQLSLVKKISTVCGNSASDVQVKCLGNGECVIMLRVPSKQQGQELGPKILNLPELTPYKVKLQMQLLQR